MKNSIEEFEEISIKQNKKTKEVENRKGKSLRRNLNINYKKMYILVTLDGTILTEKNI